MARRPAQRTATVGVVAGAVPVPIASIALRVCPELPPTTEDRIADNRAQTDAFLHAMGRAIGPPWQAKHKLAAAAAIAVAGRS